MNIKINLRDKEFSVNVSMSVTPSIMNDVPSVIGDVVIKSIKPKANVQEMIRLREIITQEFAAQMAEDLEEWNF